jgi:hypothetical protein
MDALTLRRRVIAVNRVRLWGNSRLGETEGGGVSSDVLRVARSRKYENYYRKSHLVVMGKVDLIRGFLFLSRCR